MKTVLIIGVGQFGSHIARRMEELRCEVMAGYQRYPALCDQRKDR